MSLQKTQDTTSFVKYPIANACSAKGLEEIVDNFMFLRCFEDL